MLHTRKLCWKGCWGLSISEACNGEKRVHFKFRLNLALNHSVLWPMEGSEWNVAVTAVTAPRICILYITQHDFLDQSNQKNDLVRIEIHALVGGWIPDQGRPIKRPALTSWSCIPAICIGIVEITYSTCTHGSVPAHMARYLHTWPGTCTHGLVPVHMAWYLYTWPGTCIHGPVPANMAMLEAFRLARVNFLLKFCLRKSGLYILFTTGKGRSPHAARWPAVRAG